MLVPNSSFYFFNMLSYLNKKPWINNSRQRCLWLSMARITKYKFSFYPNGTYSTTPYKWIAVIHSSRKDKQKFLGNVSAELQLALPKIFCSNSSILKIVRICAVTVFATHNWKVCELGNKKLLLCSNHHWRGRPGTLTRRWLQKNRCY